MMDPDLMLVIGLGMAFFAVPAIFGAIADKHMPWVALPLFLGACALCYFAYTEKPGGYELADVPVAVVDVIARIIN